MDKKLFVIRAASLTDAERSLALSLQGIVAKTDPCILLDVDNYLSFIDRSAYSISVVSFTQLLDIFIDKCESYSLFSLSFSSTSYNACCSLSSAVSSLAVPTSLEHLVKGRLPLLEDLSGSSMDNYDVQEYVLDKYGACLSRDGLIHQVISESDHLISLRDFAICRRWLVFYADETPKGRKLLDKVLAWADKGIAVYGWTSDEIKFVDTISRFGDYILPMDWSNNHSLFGVSEGKMVTRKHRSSAILPNKHYLAIEVSDGDNIQWLERDFAFTSYFGMRIKNRLEYPLTFTISPSLPFINPSAMKYIYGKAVNEDFATGVSGIGYMNPCAFPISYLPAFVDSTEKGMELADLHVVTLLDNLVNASEEKERTVLSYYSSKANIVGGFYEQDPSHYEGGKGHIYWSNGKPFVTVKISFWHESGDPKQVDDEWIAEMARRINALPVAPYEERGFTLMDVHPWSTTIQHLNKLVSLLDEHIQILGAEDFIMLLTKNVGGKKHGND